MRRHFVTFYSPGTFVSEESTRPIESWDRKAAVALGRSIVERYGAKPYGFVFSTCLVADPVPDGEGGTLQVIPREVERSGIHFLGGDLLTIDEVRQQADPKKHILLSNMRGNDWPIVVVNTNSFRSTLPFTEKDCIVDPQTGDILRRGNDTELVIYRHEKIKEHKAEVEMEIARAKIERERSHESSRT